MNILFLKLRIIKVYFKALIFTKWLTLGGPVRYQHLPYEQHKKEVVNFFCYLFQESFKIKKGVAGTARK
jgi:hypothetical protein